MRWVIPAAMIAVLSCLPAAAGADSKATRKLVEFGWDEPDTRFLRDHVAEMQATPFDGCVFHANYRLPNGTVRNFSWDLWGRSRFPDRLLDSARADLAATRLGRFDQSFLRVNVTPGNLDWFEDHGAVMANLELAARLAKQGGCPGVLFDIEQYQGPLWDYHAQTRAHPHTWEEMSAQVRRRGAEAMQAFEKGYPGLTVFMTVAYSLPLHENLGGRAPLSERHNGLMAPFVDGMVSAASDSAVIVDGHELSYAFRDPAQFAAKADSMRHGALRLAAQPARYLRRLSVGFGIWLDNDSDRLGWDVKDPAKNYFTPAAFATAVQAALDHADRYVWIYCQRPRWWGPPNVPRLLPAAYDSVLRAVRR